jgi:hypothetical protein
MSNDMRTSTSGLVRMRVRVRINPASGGCNKQKSATGGLARHTGTRQMVGVQGSWS